MLREILLGIEIREERRRINENNKPGTNSIAQGYDPHMLDVMRISSEAWNEVHEMNVVRCWVNSQILSVEMAANIKSLFGRMRNTSKHDDTKEIVGMLKQLSINVGQNDPIYNEFEHNVTAQEVKK